VKHFVPWNENMRSLTVKCRCEDKAPLSARIGFAVLWHVGRTFHIPRLPRLGQALMQDAETDQEALQRVQQNAVKTADVEKQVRATRHMSVISNGGRLSHFLPPKL
jgi:hypothetical protein